MHHPEGSGSLSSKCGQIDAYRSVADVLSRKTSGSANEIQGSVDAVGVNESDHSGHWRWLKRGRNHHFSAEKTPGEASGIGTPLEIDVLARYDTDLSPRLGEASAPEGKRLTADKNDLSLVAQGLEQRKNALNFLGSKGRLGLLHQR
jgi:hypothetical protein